MGLRIIPGGIFIHLHWDLRTKHDASLSLDVSLIKIYIVVEPFRHPSLQDDSYQLKNDIGVNPTFWTEEMCHYAESPFRLFPFGKLVKSLKDCVEFQFSQVRDGCHTWSSLESWSRGLWSRLLHARAPHKSRLANIGGFYISSQSSSRSHLVHHVNDVTVDIVHQSVRNKLLRKICEREIFLTHVEGVTPKYFWLQYLYSIN